MDRFSVHIMGDYSLFARDFMRKAYYYIGSHNVTHELEVQKIEQVVSKYFDGFTAFEVIGYWKGQRERTLKVEIVTEENDAVLARVGKELRVALEQESVMLEITESNCAFIQ